MDCGQRTADSVQNFALSTIWKMMVEHVLSEIVLMSAAKLPAELRETPIAHNERMAIADGIKHSNSLLTELTTLCIPSANEHMAVAPMSSEARRCGHPTAPEFAPDPRVWPGVRGPQQWTQVGPKFRDIDGIVRFRDCSGKFRDCDEGL